MRVAGKEPGGILDAGLFAQAERFRRELRLVKNTLRHRDDFLRISRGILDKLEAEGRWPKKISALRSRIAEQEAGRSELDRKKEDLETTLALYPEEYRDEKADLLDKATRSDN